MKSIAKILVPIIFLFVNASFALAQISVASNQAKDNELYVSLAWRFSIKTPGDFSDLRGFPSGGGEIIWKRNGNEIKAGSDDITDKLSSEKDSKVIDRLRDQYFYDRSIRANILESKEISLGDYAGREYKIEMPSSFSIMRFYIAEQTLFVLSANMPMNQRNQESDIIKVFDTFRILNKAYVDAEVEKLVAANTPQSLPQTPVVPKKKSDREDEGLKGKVKKITEEIATFNYRKQEGQRKKIMIVEYDENGMMTKRILHGTEGLPRDISVYGYLNNKRVSNSQFIEAGSPTSFMELVGEIPASSKSKIDMRYDYSYTYKYDLKGNRLEWLIVNNYGKVWLRYVYKYVGNKRTTLVYDEKGKLNQKYVSVFDDKGNEIEWWDFNTFDGIGKEPTKEYEYEYEYDTQGNWIKKTTRMKSGVPNIKNSPWSISYRTIIYY